MHAIMYTLGKIDNFSETKKLFYPHWDSNPRSESTKWMKVRIPSGAEILFRSVKSLIFPFVQCSTQNFIDASRGCNFQGLFLG